VHTRIGESPSELPGRRPGTPLAKTTPREIDAPHLAKMQVAVLRPALPTARAPTEMTQLSHALLQDAPSVPIPIGMHAVSVSKGVQP